MKEQVVACGGEEAWKAHVRARVLRWARGEIRKGRYPDVERMPRHIRKAAADIGMGKP